MNNPRLDIDYLRKISKNPDKYEAGDNLNLLNDAGDMLLDLMDAWGEIKALQAEYGSLIDFIGQSKRIVEVYP